MKLILSHNQRLLLDIVRSYGPVSRAEISKISGLTAGAITRHTKELLLQELLVDGETRVGQRGQPATPLSLGENSAFSIGVSFNPKQIDVVAIDFAGNTIEHKQCKFQEGPPEQAIIIIKSLIDDIINANHLSHEKCLGCGLAIPGYSTQKHSDFITVASLSSWSGIDLIETFEQGLGLPIWVENIAAAGSLAEYFTAKEKESRGNIVFLHMGYGIGLGIIVNGHLYRGEHGNSGEIGGYFPPDKARPSGADLLTTLNEAGHQVEYLSELNDVYAGTEKTISEWVTRASKQIAQLLENATYWLDPAKIIIGGPIPEHIIGSIVNTAAPICFDSLSKNVSGFPQPTILASRNGTTVTAIGAAYLPIHSYCSPSLDIHSVVRPNTFRKVQGS